MTERKISLNKSICAAAALFLLTLGVILVAVHYQNIKRTLFSQYEARIAEILRYIEPEIDGDDLAECIRTGQESAKYQELQKLLDSFKERMDIHYIYIIEPLNTEKTDNIRNVIAGATQYEYEHEADELVYLNMPTGDSYSPSTAAKYLSAYESDQLSFFEEKSEWGDDYTGLLPIHDSNGRRVAALCVDMDVAQIHTRLHESILRDIYLIVLLGIAYIAVFILWTRRNVTEPIKQLEKSAVEFASRCHDQKSVESLTIKVPQMHIKNEVYTLAHAVADMSTAMQEYAKETAAAETIAELKESISALFDNMPGMSFSKDAKTGVYLACNQAFADYAHIKDPSGVVGLTDADMFDAETAKHFVEADKLALSMDKPYIFFEDVVDAAGNPRQLQTTKLKFTDSNGRLCLLGMCADMTDARAHSLANSMITAMASDYRCVYYVDLDEDDCVCYREDPDDPDQTPVGVHFPYLDRITWYAERCVTEKYREGFLEFVQPDNIRRRLADERIIAYRYLARRKDREYYEMIRAAGVRRAEERTDHHIHAIGLGLTEIDAEMRETMARNEALADALAMAEESNLAKTSFLSNMSHEIRTPMNAIIGLDTLALHDKTISAKTREYLEKIDGSAKHLLALINDILDMSRIESGKITLNKEEFSFRDMLEQINTMVMSQCKEKGLTYDFRILSPFGDTYIGDDTKIKEVLLNILSNAVKFTEPPGTVTMTVERIAEFKDQSTLKFCVKDTGIGMDPSYIPKIFDPFSQEDGTRKSKFGSTGLGMAITKSLVEMMNGTISVESEKGVGSQFTVIITLRNCEEQEVRLENRIDRSRIHVLVIDDEEISAEHARMILDDSGIRTDAALNMEDALKMLETQHAKQEPYNLVLLDANLPEAEELEAVKAIRKEFPKETTSILLAADTFDDIREKALDAGVDGFTARPLFAEDIITEFERIVRHTNRSLFEEKKRADLAGRTILLAEDIEQNAEIMMDILEMKEVETDHAENGKIALQKFSDHEPGTYAAILMDVRMPEMDGLEATAAIRALDRSDAKIIPIIALTANAFDEDVQRSLQVGMNAHLTKPVDPDHLYQTLEELIYEAETKTAQAK